MSSTLTADKAAEKVVARLVEQGESVDGLLMPDIATWVPEALQRLARLVADGPEYVELQRAQNVAVTSGVGTLSDDILVDSLPSGLVTIGAVIYKWVPRYQSLQQTFPSNQLGHYAVAGRQIFFKSETGTSPTSTASVFCNFVPTLTGTTSDTDLPNRFEDTLINILIQMASEKKSLKPAPLLG